MQQAYIFELVINGLLNMKKTAMKNGPQKTSFMAVTAVISKSIVKNLGDNSVKIQILKS